MIRKRYRISILAVVTAGTVAAIPQRAQATALLEAAFDLSFFTKNDATAIVPMAAVHVPVGTFAIDARWGVVTGDFGDLVDFSFKPLNPYVGASMGLDLGVVDFRVGGGLAAPLIRVDDLAGSVGPMLASSMHGLWDPWLFSAETFGIAAPARAKFKIPGVDLLAEGAAFLLIPAGDARNDTDFGVQLGGEVGLPLAPMASVGARLQMVYAITAGGDNLQLSGEPFVDLGLGPASIRLGFLMNLNRPGGFAFDDNGIWAVHGGLRLDI